MCRWLAYSGSPVLLDELLFKPKHSLIDQSMSAKSADTVTNGDGFGVGWYDPRGRPTLFRSIRPAWNDFNLREICSIIESPLFLAHVRATSQATVQETNCHPFRKGRWLFVHNGEIHGIEKIRRELLFAVDPELFPHINGTTDSEVMFYLMLTFGLEQDPHRGRGERWRASSKTAARRTGRFRPALDDARIQRRRDALRRALRDRRRRSDALPQPRDGRPLPNQSGAFPGLRAGCPRRRLRASRETWPRHGTRSRSAPRSSSARPGSSRGRSFPGSLIGGPAARRRS